MPYLYLMAANQIRGDAALTWDVLIAIGLVALAFILGRIWQWFKDARNAMGSRRNRRH